MDGFDRDPAIRDALLELAKEACLTLDAAGAVRSVNESLCRLFGYAQAELLGASIHRLVPEFGGAASGPAEYVVQARRRDGATLPVSLRERTIEAASGTRVVVMMRPLMRTEENLRDSQAMLRAVADSTTAVIYIKDSDGRYILVNRRFEELFHLCNDDVRGKTDFAFLPAEVADHLRKNDLEVQHRGAPVEFDEIVPSDGEMRQYISLKVPLVRPSGEVYAVCGISTDITDRKRNEEQLVEMYRQLQGLVADRTSDLSELNRLLREESDARADLVLQLSGLVAAANEGIWTVDVDGLTTFVNPRMAAMLGYGVDELLRRPIFEFVTAAHRERAQRFLTFPHVGPQTQADLELRHKDGSTLWALTSTNPIRNARAQIVGTLCMLTDITDRKRAEEHQAQLLQELDHRVKNCLATVVGLADVSMESAASLEEFRASFSARMQAMTRTHESLAKAHWQNVELGDVVEVVLAPQRAASHGTIRAGGEPVALAPSVATPLALVLNELGTNALKHGALSSGSGQVCVTWKREPYDRFELVWTEEGGPAVRGPTAEGTGLGLIRGLVEYELGGAVTVEFLPLGLRCRIEIPPRN